jgi:hypothetical protein
MPMSWTLTRWEEAKRQWTKIILFVSVSIEVRYSFFVTSLYHCSCFEYMYPLEHNNAPVPSHSRVSPFQQDQLLMPR